MADNKIFIRIRRNSIEELLLWYGGRRASAAKVLRVVFFCGTDYVGQIHDLCSSTGGQMSSAILLLQYGGSGGGVCRGSYPIESTGATSVRVAHMNR